MFDCIDGVIEVCCCSCWLMVMMMEERKARRGVVFNVFGQ